MNVTTCVNLLGQYHLIWPQGMKSGRVGGVTAEAVSVLLKEIRLYTFIRNNTMAIARINTVVVAKI